MLLNSQSIYKGRIIDLNLETVELPDGNSCELEIIHHPGGVAVLAINDKQEICLVRQFRHAAGGWIWELPAGKIEQQEDIKTTAQCELAEEAGFEANSWVYLGKCLSSPGVFTEIIHLYRAQDLTEVGQQLEEHEVLEVHWFKPQTIHDMIRKGEIIDSKTVVALYYLQLSNSG